MSIIRVAHNRENPYVQLNKKALWDENLPLEAVGLWARCISRPSNWKFHLNELARACKINKGTMQKYMNILIENNYVIRYQKKSLNNSRFDSMEYMIFEFQLCEEEKQYYLEELKKCLPETDFQSTEENTVSGNFVNGDLAPTKERDIQQKNKDDDDARETADLKAIVDQEKSIPEEIKYRSPSGQERSISKNEIFRRFVKKPFKTQTIIDAIKRLVERQDLIGDVFKYLEAICSQIESNDHTIKKPERKPKRSAADSIPMPKKNQEFAPAVSWEEVEKKRKAQKGDTK